MGFEANITKLEYHEGHHYAVSYSRVDNRLIGWERLKPEDVAKYRTDTANDVCALLNGTQTEPVTLEPAPQATAD